MSQKPSQKSRVRPKSRRPTSAISDEKSKPWENIKTSISNPSTWREVTTQLIAAAIIGGVGFFIAYLSDLPPFQSINKQQTELLTGTWNILMKYTIPNGAYSQEGRIEYLKSGDYNFSGRLIFDITKDKKNSKIVYHAQASGSWQIKDNHLIIRLKDLKRRP